MPTSRKRRSAANTDACRQLRRRKHHAAVRRMVDFAEQQILRQARESGRAHCNYVIPSSEWTDKQGTTHLVEPAPCGGRMKPIKRGGAVVPGVARCNRCGREAIVVDTPTRPESPETPESADPGSQDPGSLIPEQIPESTAVETGQVGTPGATSPHQNP